MYSKPVKKKQKTEKKVELKKVDVVRPGSNGATPDIPALFPFSDAPTATYLNPVIPGNGFYQRIGNRIQGQSLNMNILFVPKNVVHVNSFTGKLVVIYDKQPNGNAPAYTTIFSAQTFSGTVTTNPLTLPLNIAQRDRFVVISSEYVTLPGTGQSIQNPQEFTKNIYRELKDIEIVYSGNDGSIGACSSGALLLFLVTNDAAPNYDAMISSRFVFKDI